MPTGRYALTMRIGWRCNWAGVRWVNWVKNISYFRAGTSRSYIGMRGILRLDSSRVMEKMLDRALFRSKERKQKRTGLFAFM